MRDGFAERMHRADVAKDTRLLGDFAVIHCRGVHAGRERLPLTSDGASLGVYGRKTPEVCPECAELLAYAEERRAFCQRDPKPFCSHCESHCYRPAMRDRMREVMKYSGPRSVVRGHAIDSVRHMLASRRVKRGRGSATTAEARKSDDDRPFPAETMPTDNERRRIPHE